MRTFLKFLAKLLCMEDTDSFGLFETQQPRSFRLRYKPRSTVVAALADDLSGERLTVMFQRPIESSDVEDGKLLPTAYMGRSERGGKRQTILHISLESAEALHAVLGKAIEVSKMKRRQRIFTEGITKLFLSSLRNTDDILHSN